LLKNRADCPSSGFTLIEVLVALAIAALGLGALMAAAGTGIENTTLADQYIEATRRAQSHLAATGTLTPLRAGIQSGDDGGGYYWRVRVSQPTLHAAAPGPEAQKPLGLYTVEVTLSWRSDFSTRSVSLQSQRLSTVSDANG
jgi:general secretion pathway protein I